MFWMFFLTASEKCARRFDLKARLEEIRCSMPVLRQGSDWICDSGQGGTSNHFVDWISCEELLVKRNSGFQQITSLISCHEYFLLDRPICNLKQYVATLRWKCQYFICIKKNPFVFVQQLHGYLGPPAALVDGKLGVHFRGVKLCVECSCSNWPPKLALCRGESKWETGLGKMASREKRHGSIRSPSWLTQHTFLAELGMELSQ